MTPLQFGCGSARRLKLWPTTGLKSFFMSHSSIRCGRVSARQIFSGGCGSSRSTTTESLSVMGSIIGQPCRLPARQLADLDEIAASIIHLRDGCACHRFWWHGEFPALRLDTFILGIDIVGKEIRRRLALLKHRLLIGA